jgi:hypothetical protein
MTPEPPLAPPLPLPPPPPPFPPPAQAPAPVTAPLEIGQVLGRTAAIWSAQLVPIAAVTLIAYLPVLVASALAPASQPFQWLLQLLGGLAALVVRGGVTPRVIAQLRGEPGDGGSMISAGLGNFGKVFSVSFRVGLYLILGAFLLVVPAIIWACKYYLAVPAMLVDGEDGPYASALDRSAGLTAGSRWRIFAVGAIIFLATVVTSFLAGAILGLTGLDRAGRVAGTVIAAFSVSFSSCAAAVAYHQLRLAKEGPETAALGRVFE